jgi:hypothetical protein
MRVILLLPLLCISLCSCHALKRMGKKKPTAPAEPTSPQAEQIGSVSLIHPDYNFVLIQTRKGFSLPDGTVLKCYSPMDMESAKLKTTPARQGNYITADITSGAPKKGDRVLYDPAGVLKPGKPLAPPPPTGSPQLPALPRRSSLASSQLPSSQPPALPSGSSAFSPSVSARPGGAAARPLEPELPEFDPQPAAPAGSLQEAPTIPLIAH